MRKLLVLLTERPEFLVERTELLIERPDMEDSIGDNLVPIWYGGTFVVASGATGGERGGEDRGGEDRGGERGGERVFGGERSRIAAAGTIRIISWLL